VKMKTPPCRSSCFCGPAAHLFAAYSHSLCWFSAWSPELQWLCYAKVAIFISCLCLGTLFGLLRPKNVLIQRKMDYFYKLIRVVLAQLFHSSWCISFCLLRFLVTSVLRFTVEGCRKSFYIDTYKNGLSVTIYEPIIYHIPLCKCMQ